MPVITEPFLDNNTSDKFEALKGNPNPTIEKEKIALRKKVKQRLVEAKKYAAPIDWRQFALMNNTSFIKGSSFDRGHHAFSCLVAYLNYLNLLQKEGTFFSSERGEQALQELNEALQTSKKILSNFPGLTDGALNERELGLASSQILSMINDELAQKSYIYFPAGYCGRDERAPGHGLACKISKDPTLQWVTISFLNLGEGAQHHPELAATTTHMKSSYSYYPAVIPTTFWEEIAPSFLSHLLRFISDLPHKKTTYSAQDLYDLLAALQSLSIEYIIKRGETLSGKLQHVGDCCGKVNTEYYHRFSSYRERTSTRAR